MSCNLGYECGYASDFLTQPLVNNVKEKEMKTLEQIKDIIYKWWVDNDPTLYEFIEALNNDDIRGISYDDWDKLEGNWSHNKAEILEKEFTERKKKEENIMKFEDIELYQVFKVEGREDLLAKVNDSDYFIFKGSLLGTGGLYTETVGSIENVYNVKFGTIGNLMTRFIKQDFEDLELVWEKEDKYAELSKGDICEVWDDDDEDDKIPVYYAGEGLFKATKKDNYLMRYDNFKLIKKAE